MKKRKVSLTTIILAIFTILSFQTGVSYALFDDMILVHELNQIYGGMGILFLLTTIISYKVDCIQHKEVKE